MTAPDFIIFRGVTRRVSGLRSTIADGIANAQAALDESEDKDFWQRILREWQETERELEAAIVAQTKTPA